MTPESTYGRELTSDQTAQLLQVSLTGASRPVDVLVERLSQRDGGAWLQRSLSALLTEQDLQILHDDQPAAETVATLKKRAKRHLDEASDQQSHLAALMCYCLTVARGLRLIMIAPSAPCCAGSRESV